MYWSLGYLIVKHLGTRSFIKVIVITRGFCILCYISCEKYSHFENGVIRLGVSSLDLSKSIYELCQENEEIVSIMVQLGFDQIANPIIRNTAGRAMTIPKGAKAKGISIGVIIEAFEQAGYMVIGKELFIHE
ncbi:DUF1858 domain-containing protein [Paenibacillus sp. UMB4589-SE434]|nr:DUF1858 domain-containing protein [Paenibacillus sp. UMB4589-SE434]